MYISIIITKSPCLNGKRIPAEAFVLDSISIGHYVASLPMEFNIPRCKVS